jgi:hypothetical protein
VRIVTPASIRFERSYIPEPNSGCWLWLGAVTLAGYGQMYYPPQNMVRAHIVAWELYRGPRRGLHVLHNCDNPCCVNPDHLRLGTQQDNMDDREARHRRTPPAGERNGRATITEDTVCAIRADKRKAGVSYRDFSFMPRSTFQKIRNRQTWKHVP